MNRKITIILLLACGTVILAWGQDASELNRRNGFKSIKLAGSIDSVKGAVLRKEFMEKDEFPAKLYETESPEYKFIGDVAVKQIKLMTYKNLIYKIVVTTKKDPRVMQALEKSFGKSVFVVRSNSYNWKAERLSLFFRTDKNAIELTYRSYLIYKMMKEDKGQKVDAISDDF